MTTTDPRPADSIVIPRADLPEVHQDGRVLTVGATHYPATLGADHYRAEARKYLALAEHLDAQEPAPLAVGDRVRVVVPEDTDGVRVTALAVGDEGTVVAEADEDGDILFRRDGTETSSFIAAANVEHLDHQQPAPLAVGDRVRVLSPVMSNGARTFSLAEGDIGTVIAEADEDGDIRLHRDGTEGGICVAAANVERIEDDPPRVGDIVRVHKAERADGETSWLPEVGKEYRVAVVAGDGDLVMEKDDDGLHRIVDSRHVTVVRRAER